jgi:hypothetical protein
MPLALLLLKSLLEDLFSPRPAVCVPERWDAIDVAELDAPTAGQEE